jgi:hypothetical protein
MEESLISIFRSRKVAWFECSSIFHQSVPQLLIWVLNASHVCSGLSPYGIQIPNTSSIYSDDSRIGFLGSW